jgi:hypothetical protein
MNRKEMYKCVLESAIATMLEELENFEIDTDLIRFKIHLINDELEESFVLES